MIKSIVFSCFGLHTVSRFLAPGSNGGISVTLPGYQTMVILTKKLIILLQEMEKSCSANTDHHLVITRMQLWLPMIHRTALSCVRYDTDRLLKGTSLAYWFCLSVLNKFEAFSTYQGEDDEV